MRVFGLRKVWLLLLVAGSFPSARGYRLQKPVEASKFDSLGSTCNFQEAKNSKVRASLLFKDL